MVPRTLFAAIAAAIALTPTFALAHTGLGDAHDFTHGFTHPIGGLDHVLAMVAVGMLAARLGGRALWLVPASFVCVTAAAGVLGAMGVAVPFVETGIALSVLVLGAALAFDIEMPLAAAMALVGLFAIFHGHVHGAEMPASVSGLSYGLGFVAATIMLHATGIGIGLLVAATRFGERIVRIAGAGAVLVGASLLVGVT
jgi:urease accessory protein